MAPLTVASAFQREGQEEIYWCRREQGRGGPQQRQPGGAEPQALQGEAAAPGAGMAGNRCLPTAPEGAQPTKHLGFSPVELISGFPLPHGRE